LRQRSGLGGLATQSNSNDSIKTDGNLNGNDSRRNRKMHTMTVLSRVCNCVAESIDSHKQRNNSQADLGCQHSKQQHPKQQHSKGQAVQKCFREAPSGSGQWASVPCCISAAPCRQTATLNREKGGMRCSIVSNRRMVAEAATCSAPPFSWLLVCILAVSGLGRLPNRQAPAGVGLDLSSSQRGHHGLATALRIATAACNTWLSVYMHAAGAILFGS